MLGACALSWWPFKEKTPLRDGKWEKEETKVSSDHKEQKRPELVQECMAELEK